ncbi:very short patch repair endonuclease [Oricola indica]|uniref:very short patch repair endonuclease n=1 Tax=Oricola indica TaxID=2872591 RepID=UPI001CBAAE3C|nr:very short patch repair endonuclease [Oricola indica]
MSVKINPDRSRQMALIKAKDTKPEMIVRRAAHRLGYRFRLHRRDLPGNPDLVFPKRRAVIFVHGCFWHGHDCKRGARIPKTRTDYWLSKIARNKERDKTSIDALEADGWRVLVIWECELRDASALDRRLVDFLSLAPAGGIHKAITAEG